MRKILITGAAGFIGSHLVEQLLKDGERPENLVLLIPEGESLANLPNKNFSIVRGDVRKKNDVEMAMKNISIVYHLAAKTVVDKGTYDYYKDTNVDGTRNIVQEAVKNKVKKLIFFSSISAFGLPAWKGNMENYNETFPKIPSEPYGKTKLEAEKIVMNASQKSGLPYIIIRPTTVYGPRDKAGIAQLFTAVEKGLFFFIGNGQNKMDYVFVGDLVRAARMAEKSKIVNEDFIIGAGSLSTQRRIVECIARCLGKKLPPFSIPKFIALALAYMVKSVSQILGVKPLLFPARVRVLTSNCYFDIQKAKRMLGYKPKIAIEKGIELTYRSLYIL